MAAFEHGIELNRAFYDEVVAPILAPWPHGAALLGWGSEILGYDTARSTDHGWGPRLRVFAAAGDLTSVRDAIGSKLPAEFRGWPVHYGWDENAASHRVEIDTLGAWLSRHLGHDATTGMSTIDWLLAPQQLLLGVTRGAVYHDDDGALGAVRARLAYFPDAVWRWIVACQWQRVAQEEAFVARAAEIGDQLGARVIATRQVHELMRLWFLFAREYWPYAKWFGSAFSQLHGADDLTPLLTAVLDARDAPAREAALVAAYETVARRHNDAGVSGPVDPTARGFHGRGYRVLMAERFVAACRASIDDPMLADCPLVGSVDEVTDSTDVLSVGRRARLLGALYTGERFPDVHGDP
jgi:hypothetical protein